MYWTQFLIALASCYAIYYALNIIFDLFSQRSAPTTDQHTTDLVFQEHEKPIPIGLDPPSARKTAGNGHQPAHLISGEILSSGSVSITELQRLAKEDLIEYTKSIPF